jgi:hypothetical protein
MMLPAGGRPATSWVHYTTSCNTQPSAPEYEQNNCPKHVELIGIINKSLLLHLVGCLYYLYFSSFFWDLLNNLNLTLIPKTWRIWWANNACKWQMGFNSAFKGLFWYMKFSMRRIKKKIPSFCRETKIFAVRIFTKIPMLILIIKPNHRVIFLEIIEEI